MRQFRVIYHPDARYTSDASTGPRRARSLVRQLMTEFEPKTVEDLVALYEGWTAVRGWTWYATWGRRNLPFFDLTCTAHWKHKSFEGKKFPGEGKDE